MESARDAGDEPPVHTIDLSLPPAKRYVGVASIYRDELRSITGLFDELVLSFLPENYLPRIKTLARFFLRRLYSDEETEEIRGISETAGVEMYLVVALNVFLDILMGCTSGAALSKNPTPTENFRNPGNDEGDETDSSARLLHFRTLDWGMPALRKILVCLEFIHGPDPSVLATNITYVGFVGVLTGVRKGLSVSLNFRPYHHGSSLWHHIRYYGSHVLVLLGLRRSISSMLRRFIIPPTPQRPPRRHLSSWLLFWRGAQSHLPLPHQLPSSKAAGILASTPSTAAYLILCDGTFVWVLEKDHRHSAIEFSRNFLVATNSDRLLQPPTIEEHQQSGTTAETGLAVSLADFIQDSIERRDCIQAHWDMKVARARQAARMRRASENDVYARRDPLGRTRSSQRQDADSAAASSSSLTAVVGATGLSRMEDTPDTEVTASLEEIVTWTTMYPTTNEMTHFATVMDPTKGAVAWIRRYLEPLPLDWDCDDFD